MRDERAEGEDVSEVAPVRSAAEVPEPVDDYYDMDGYVYRGVTQAEAAKNGLALITEKQREAMQPMNRFDRRMWEVIQERNRRKIRNRLFAELEDERLAKWIASK